MNRLADAIIVLWGWRRYALALIAGAATVLAFAPFDIFPVAWLTIPVLVWLIDGSVPPEGTGLLRRFLPAAAAGWWFGFGFFLAGLWWVGMSFLVDAATFAWLLPVAVIALPAGLALFWALGAVLARLFWTDGWSRVLVFAVAMTLAEWLRGHALTGFPWNAFGYALMPNTLMMQPASLVGLWGMTLAAFLLFAAPAMLAGAVERGRGRWLAVAALLLLFVADIAFGLLRLRADTDTAVAGVRLRIVQPSIAQTVKADAEQAEAIFAETLQLSAAPPQNPAPPPTLVIWAETAVPFLLAAHPEALTAIADHLPEGATLITGAPRGERSPDGTAHFFNSVYVVDSNGAIVDAYDKVHLVPFGEYLPYAAAVERWGLSQLVALPGGFSPGPVRRTLAADGAPPFAPLICYEAIFPNEVLAPGSRPGWLLNLTNDGWFGDTPGPRQHLRQAIVRAVEEGLPLVRAANSGISAIVDPYGRVRARLDVGERGVLDGALPASLPPTVYARFGDILPAILLLLVASIAIATRIPLVFQKN